VIRLSFRSGPRPPEPILFFSLGSPFLTRTHYSSTDDALVLSLFSFAFTAALLPLSPLFRISSSPSDVVVVPLSTFVHEPFFFLGIRFLSPFLLSFMRDHLFFSAFGGAFVSASRYDSPILALDCLALWKVLSSGAGEGFFYATRSPRR